MTPTVTLRPLQMLVMNCGSSSIKYQLLDMGRETWQLKGCVENIGTDSARYSFAYRRPDERIDTDAGYCNCPHALSALQQIADRLAGGKHRIDAIVHRVVHGGEYFSKPTPVTAAVMQTLATLNELAPLHNPANVQGIALCADYFADVPQFAVFDTAFHTGMPAHAARYAIPDAWHALGVRRYGFHGSSHHYVAQRAADWLKKPLTDTNLITLHLGNGASVTAIRRGVSIDTSMGFTPLEGLMMGTRSGDLDAGIPSYIAQHTHATPADIDAQLNHDAGLKAIAGTNDMREVLSLAEGGNANAQLALEMYCYRAKKYVGAYLAALGYADAIVFTGGIGEHAAIVRERILDWPGVAGIVLDAEKNAKAAGECSHISDDYSSIPVLVIATNEELHMARQVACLMAAT